MTPYEGVIHITVGGGGDDHNIDASDKFGRQFPLALIYFAAVEEFGNIRVEEHDVGTLRAQLVDNTDCGRFATVVNIRLVSDAEHKYPRSVEWLAEAAVEHIPDTLHTVFGHTVVDLRRCLYRRKSEIVRTRLMIQKTGIDRYAVTA